MEWLKKALLEDLEQEKDIRSNQLNVLIADDKKYSNRIGKLQDSYFDGLITEETYKEKMQEYTNSKKAIEDTLASLHKNEQRYYQLSVNLYDLSQRAPELYLKADNNKKRAMLRFLFSSLQVFNKELLFEFSKHMKTLYTAVEEIQSSKLDKIRENENENFEPIIRTDRKGQEGVFVDVRPGMLPRQDSNLRP